MKKISYMFAALAAVATLTGCSSEEEFAQNSTQKGQTINLTLDATLGEQATSRSTITYNDQYASLESKWSAGDKIYVYSQKTGEKLGYLTQTGEIINQKSSTTAQNVTSYAKFAGSVTLGAIDQMSDTYTFIYQGANTDEVTVTDGKLTYDLTNSASTTLGDMAKYDIAMATGKIQGTAAAASANVGFSNMMGFGYFTTEGCTLSGDPTTTQVSYNSSFTLDVKSGTITGVAGNVTIPVGAKFYMPLIPGDVKMTSTNRTWGEQGGKLGYTDEGLNQSIQFSASAGNYYRLGKTSDYGPVAFTKSSTWTCWETMKGKVFTVAEGKTVSFTQGNLQYMYVDGTNNYWQFAPTQYSYLGSANGKIASGQTTFTGNIDLFGWGAMPAADGTMYGENNNNNYPCGTGTTKSTNFTEPSTYSTANADLNATNYLDWGRYLNKTNQTIWIDKTNSKSVTQPTNGYRVLTSGEWKYLLETRTFSDDVETTKSKTFAFATVTLSDNNTKVCGIVVFPDGVTLAQANTMGFTTLGNPSATSGKFGANYVNQSVIDDNGLLFLPAAGYRDGTGVGGGGSTGRYWSSSANNATTARTVYFIGSSFNLQRNDSRYYGFSVRLVQDNQ